MAVCKYCGKEYPDNASFCNKCGKPNDAVKIQNALNFNDNDKEKSSDDNVGTGKNNIVNNAAVIKNNDADNAAVTTKVTVNSKMWWILAACIFAVVVIAVSVVLIIVMYHKNHPQVVTETIEEETPNIVTESSERTEETLKGGISRIGFLCTSYYYYTHVSTYSDSKQLWGYTIPGTTSSYVLTCDGTITAGVDFAKAQFDIDEDAGTITVTLPAAVIFTNSIDPDSWETVDEKTGIFNPISVDDVTEAYDTIEKDEEEKAIERGLLDDAQNNAEVILENMLYQLGISDEYKVEINFESSGS